MFYTLALQSTYNFQMLAPEILGYNFKNAKVLALLDFDSANKEQDIAPLHASIYPFLPNGTPINPSQLIYVKVRTSTGSIRVLAMDWIAIQPTLVTETEATVVIRGIDLAELPRIRQILVKNGYLDITISAKTT